MAFSYHRGYETPGNPTAAGETAPTRHPVAKKRQESVGSSPCPECFRKLCVSVVAELQEERPKRTKAHSHPRSSSKAFRVPEEETGGVAFERPPSRRLHHRLMDARSYCQADREALRCPVSSLSCLEASEDSGLELPETRASGPTEGRRGHRTLEEEQMAPDKKKPKKLGPIWSSSMKAASCLFLISNAPGPLKATPPFSTISTGKIASPPSMPSAYLLKEGEWPCISDSTPKTSRAWRCSVSLGTSFGICEAPLSFCGTGERSTSTARSRPCSLAIPESKWSPSQLMPLSSTRQSMFGTRQTPLYPTARPEICPIFGANFAALWPGYENPKIFSGHASSPANYRGQIESFHYLCKVQ